ncbi:MAG TPA: creatininase family protein [Pseudomonadales bacterium]|nr:creatininase family protein [Pseudomonadales bacterium]
MENKEQDEDHGMHAIEQRPLFWDRLTWEDVKALPKSGMNLCLLPVGATEQHGPHLGVGMDSRNAALLCEAVSRETGAPILPALNYGCSLGHSWRWPGTLSLQPQTLMDMVTQIFDWLYRSGFKKILIVNGHVGNAAPLRCAVDIIRSRYDDAMARVCNVAEISSRVRAEFFADAEDWHANAAETSLMLALAPEMVRPDKLSQSDDGDRTANLVFTHPVNRTSKNGVTGFPSRATHEQGEKLFRFMVEDMTALVRRAEKEKAPLEQSYFSPIE